MHYRTRLSRPIAALLLAAATLTAACDSDTPSDTGDGENYEFLVGSWVVMVYQGTELPSMVTNDDPYGWESRSESGTMDVYSDLLGYIDIETITTFDNEYNNQSQTDYTVYDIRLIPDGEDPSTFEIRARRGDSLVSLDCDLSDSQKILSCTDPEPPDFGDEIDRSAWRFEKT